MVNESQNFTTYMVYDIVIYKNKTTRIDFITNYLHLTNYSTNLMLKDFVHIGVDHYQTTILNHLLNFNISFDSSFHRKQAVKMSYYNPFISHIIFHCFIIHNINIFPEHITYIPPN